jgi:hypothetical protein
MADLSALVYVSSAKHLLSAAELEHLLKRARARNAEHEVTGVLLYAFGNFMQYLEGPPAGMSTVYDVIKADPLHHGIIELLREPIDAREFADWTMAFRDIRPFGSASPPQIDAIFSTARSVRPRPESAGHVLLSTFWHKGGAGVGF